MGPSREVSEEKKTFRLLAAEEQPQTPQKTPIWGYFRPIKCPKYRVSFVFQGEYFQEYCRNRFTGSGIWIIQLVCWKFARRFQFLYPEARKSIEALFLNISALEEILHIVTTSGKNRPKISQNWGILRWTGSPNVQIFWYKCARRYHLSYLQAWKSNWTLIFKIWVLGEKNTQ